MGNHHRKRVTLVLVLVMVIGVGGWMAVRILSPTDDWRLADQWQGKSLNRPSSTGQKILAGTLEYLETKPSYDGSRVYPGGVPTDGTGVCTDVVWYGAKAGGVNLRDAVDQDRHSAPQEYAKTAPSGEVPDANIDYRRVRNLLVYFHRHAQSLTTDTTEVSAWQPGDIVVFREHVGVVSDRRNAMGLPYLLHHEPGMWARYEADVIGSRPVRGHFRLG